MDSHKTFYPAGTEIGQYQDYPGINFAVWVAINQVLKFYIYVKGNYNKFHKKLQFRLQIVIIFFKL